MNSEDDLSQSLNEIELEGFDQTEKIDDPELLKLQNYEVSSMSSDDFILTASMMEEDDCLSTKGPVAEELVITEFTPVKQVSMDLAISNKKKHQSH